MHVEIQVPQYRPFSSVIIVLREKFPYRAGDWFDQVVSGDESDLVIIRLAYPLSEEQKVYLDHGKNCQMILAYCEKE